MDTSSKRGDRTVLRRAITIIPVFFTRALDLANRLVQVAHLRGVALLDVLDGLLEAADPALDRRDELSRQGGLACADGTVSVKNGLFLKKETTHRLLSRRRFMKMA